MHPFNQTPFGENYPQPVDVAAFQTKLNALFGFHLTTGRPWVRIVWAPSSERDKYGDLLTFDWNQYGDGGRGMWRRRYLYDSRESTIEAKDPETGLWYARQVFDDIAAPRFMLERFVPPETACAGWQQKGVDKDGAKWTERSKPVNGYYDTLNISRRVSPLLAGGMLCTHDSVCCANAKKAEVDCYGFYIEPSREHIAELERIAFAQRHAKEERPGEMTAAQYEAARKRNTEAKEAAIAATAARTGQIVAEALRTHKGSLSDDESVRKNGVFHWVGAHTKSGLPSLSKFKITPQHDGAVESSE